ncbi:hypothetical protein N1851_033019 [Merluccius polli]|uniref:Uncharacterized protein n=1 Tax=Merluccius polli TaxID=89951 RepID=A0AA47M296_MERPO|nr:hypothetical protein N1851_033019 [Merluccius polli]
MKHKNIIQNANRKKAEARKTGGGPPPPPLTNRGRPVAEGIPGGSSSESVTPHDTSAYIRCKYTLMSLKKIKLIYKYIAYFLTNIYPPTHQLWMVSSVNPAAVSIPYSDLASDGSSKDSETESFPASQEEEDDDEETLSAATGRDPEGPTELSVKELYRVHLLKTIQKTEKEMVYLDRKIKKTYLEILLLERQLSPSILDIGRDGMVIRRVIDLYGRVLLSSNNCNALSGVTLS